MSVNNWPLGHRVNHCILREDFVTKEVLNVDINDFLVIRPVFTAIFNCPLRIYLIAKLLTRVVPLCMRLI